MVINILSMLEVTSAILPVIEYSFIYIRTVTGTNTMFNMCVSVYKNLTIINQQYVITEYDIVSI